MNKSTVSLAAILLGSALGFYIGFVSKQSGLDLFKQTFSGIFFGYLVGLALFWKKYGVFIWSLISLTIVVLVDWIAGSSWTIYGKLEFMTAGLLVGWDFWRFRMQVAILGVIGAVCGFVLGMNNRVWFGTVHLDPGLWNAMLLTVKFSILGIGIGRLIIEIFGWRPKVDDFE